MRVDNIEVSIQICWKADLAEEMATGQEQSSSPCWAAVFIQGDV